VSELAAVSHIHMKTAHHCLLTLLMLNRFFALNICFKVNTGLTHKKAYVVFTSFEVIIPNIISII
jgi:hypothetical protein